MQGRSYQGAAFVPFSWVSGTAQNPQPPWCVPSFPVPITTVPEQDLRGLAEGSLFSPATASVPVAYPPAIGIQLNYKLKSGWPRPQRKFLVGLAQWPGPLRARCLWAALPSPRSRPLTWHLYMLLVLSPDSSCGF